MKEGRGQQEEAGLHGKGAGSWKEIGVTKGRGYREGGVATRMDHVGRVTQKGAWPCD